MQDSTRSMQQVRIQNLANVPISTESRQFWQSCAKWEKICGMILENSVCSAFNAYN